MGSIEDHLDTALLRIAYSLEANRVEFGVADFPAGGAMRFRNAFFDYPYSVARSIAFTIAHEPSDQWVEYNLRLISAWTDEHWWKAIGVLHVFYMAQQLHRELQLVAVAESPDTAAGFISVTENWLFNAYELERTERLRWARLIRSEEVAPIDCRRIADKLLEDAMSRVAGVPITFEHCWGGLAYHAAMNCPGPSDESYATYRDSTFREAESMHRRRD